MRYSKFLGLVLVLVMLTVNVQASGSDDIVGEVVITATRVETPGEDVPNSITVVTAEEIEASGVRTVAEVLETVPGLEFNALGGIGQQQSLFIRGADPAHVLVMIDGMEVNDPSTPKRAFNWAHLSVENIERIEVVRGPAGPVYGSDAMAGVVNIITKRGEGEQNIAFEIETGSYKMFLGRFTLIGGKERTSYSVALSGFETESISAAEENNGNTEKDAYRNTTLSGTLDTTLGKKAKLFLTFRAHDSRTELDENNANFPYAFGDDPNSTITEMNLTLGARLDLSSGDGIPGHRIGLSVTDYQREYLNPPDSINPDDSHETDDGVNWHLNWQGTYDLESAGLITVGLDLDKDTVESEADFSGFPITIDRRDATNLGVYFQDKIDLTEGLLVSAGVRVDYHEEFDNEFTYRFGFVKNSTNEEFIFKGSIATGFKAPTIYQLYNSSSGNLDLDPETSTGWDLGAEKYFGDDSIGISYFNNVFDNLIDFSGFAYFNIDEAKTEGLEVYADMRLADPFTLMASYTALVTEDMTTGEDLIRRPENKISLQGNYRFENAGHLNLTGIYVSERQDRDFSSWPATPVTLASYTLVNLAGSWRISDDLNLTGRIENLLDEDYQEAFGYGTPGLSAYVGVKAEL